MMLELHDADAAVCAGIGQREEAASGAGLHRHFRYDGNTGFCRYYRQ
jgi:hypothetical protein